MHEVYLDLAMTEKDLHLFLLHPLRIFLSVSNIMQSEILFQKFSLGSHKNLPFFRCIFSVVGTFPSRSCGMESTE